MYIVNRATFLAMPEGTVFAKYEPCIFGELCVKGQTLEGSNDFVYQGFDWIDPSGNSSYEEWMRMPKHEEPFDVLYEMVKTGRHCQIDQGANRDGLYENDQLFAIYERDDIEFIVKTLTMGFEGEGK